MNLAHPKWKWLVETPLAPRWRARLELCLGVVLSSAAVVALAGTFEPDPTRLARRAPSVPTSALATVAAAPPSLADASEGLSRAAHEGDVRAMAKHYIAGIPLSNMLAPAARSGKKAAVAWLLDHGADPHENEYSMFAPMLAGDAHPEIVALLRARGAKDPSLEVAAMANAPNMVARILESHPNVDERGSYPLHASATSQSGEVADKWRIVRRLLAEGADPSRAPGATTPLGGVVADCDRPDAGDCMPIVNLLLERGAKVTGDALGIALALDASVRARPLAALLDAPLAKGVTAEGLAAATRVSPEDAANVCAKGVDWAWHDGEDDAALPVIAAVRRGDRDLVRALLDAGAPVDRRYKDGSSALAEAIDGASGNPAQARIVELLVSRGAKVNQRLPDGRTPLFAAAESGDLRVVSFLLERGARVNDLVLDDMALDVADQNGHVAVARVLHAHGARRNRPRLMYPSGG